MLQKSKQVKFFLDVQNLEIVEFEKLNQLKQIYLLMPQQLVLKI